MPRDLELRTCGRTGCRWPAAASLSFRYDTRQVWLADLTPEPDPALYDLCPDHADALTVPRGWERVDERTAEAPVAEPAGRDLDPDDGGTPPGAGGYGRNRYAALTAALPRLARELREGDTDAEPAEREAVVPSRDLAPVPALALAPQPAPSPAAPAAPSPAAPPASAAPDPAPVPAPGPLADRTGEDAGATDRAGEGVVVPLDQRQRLF